MPFKPRIVRFDAEHTAVPAPAGRRPTSPLGAALVTAHDPESGVDESSNVETPPHDPTHDTIRGEEFDTLANWDPDDALLNDSIMQCLARQLSDDAEQLAKRFPAEGWIPPAVEESAEQVVPQPARKSSAWRRAIGFAAALAASAVLVSLGPQSLGPRLPENVNRLGDDLESSRQGAPSLGGATPPTDHVTYEDGDVAVWGENPVDDSQFGEVEFGVLQFNEPGTAGGAFDVLSTPAREALRELLPADSHEHCDVSM